MDMAHLHRVVGSEIILALQRDLMVKLYRISISEYKYCLDYLKQI